MSEKLQPADPLASASTMSTPTPTAKDFELDLIRQVARAREVLARLIMAIAPLAEISEEAERAAQDLVERLKAEVQIALAAPTFDAEKFVEVCAHYEAEFGALKGKFGN